MTVRVRVMDELVAGSMSFLVLSLGPGVRVDRPQRLAHASPPHNPLMGRVMENVAGPKVTTSLLVYEFTFLSFAVI